MTTPSEEGKTSLYIKFDSTPEPNSLILEYNFPTKLINQTPQPNSQFF